MPHASIALIEGYIWMAGGDSAKVCGAHDCRRGSAPLAPLGQASRCLEARGLVHARVCASACSLLQYTHIVGADARWHAEHMHERMVAGSQAAFPLGFSTGDAELDEAARVLRILCAPHPCRTCVPLGCVAADTGCVVHPAEIRNSLHRLSCPSHCLLSRSRVRYVAELRRLQDAINEVVVSMQEFTANPKTDSRLGKVGR